MTPPQYDPKSDGFLILVAVFVLLFGVAKTLVWFWLRK